MRKIFPQKVGQNFSRKFGEIRAKILRTPKNLPAATPMGRIDLIFFGHFKQNSVTDRRQNRDATMVVSLLYNFTSTTVSTVFILNIYCFVLATALDVQAFERLLGPCKELLMRNIPLYEQQLNEIYQDMSLSCIADNWRHQPFSISPEDARSRFLIGRPGWQQNSPYRFLQVFHRFLPMALWAVCL